MLMLITVLYCSASLMLSPTIDGQGFSPGEITLVAIGTYSAVAAVSIYVLRDGKPPPADSFSVYQGHTAKLNLKALSTVTLDFYDRIASRYNSTCKYLWYHCNKLRKNTAAILLRTREAPTTIIPLF